MQTSFRTGAGLVVLAALLLGCRRQTGGSGAYLTDETIHVYGRGGESFTTEATDPSFTYAVRITGTADVSCWAGTGWFDRTWNATVDARYRRDADGNFTKRHSLLGAGSWLRLVREDRATHTYDFVTGGTGHSISFRIGCPWEYPISSDQPSRRSLSVHVVPFGKKTPLDYGRALLSSAGTHVGAALPSPATLHTDVLPFLGIMGMAFFFCVLAALAYDPVADAREEKARVAARERQAAEHAARELREKKAEAAALREAERALMEHEVELHADLLEMRSRFEVRLGKSRGAKEYDLWRAARERQRTTGGQR